MSARELIPDFFATANTIQSSEGMTVTTSQWIGLGKRRRAPIGRAQDPAGIQCGKIQLAASHEGDGIDRSASLPRAT